MSPARFLLACSAVVLSACGSSDGPSDDPRMLTLGTWYISSCSIVSVANPARTASCGPAHPTRLDVDADYAFATTPLPPGDDSLSSSHGRFLLTRGQIELAYDRLPPTGSVEVLRAQPIMTWSAATEAVFENPHEVLPAVSTIIWSRTAP